MDADAFVLRRSLCAPSALGTAGSAPETGYVYYYVQLSADLGGDDDSVCGILLLLQSVEKEAVKVQCH